MLCHRYAEANSKYMKNYDKNKELLYFQERDMNNLCGCEMSQEYLWVVLNGLEIDPNLMKIS